MEIKKAPKTIVRQCRNCGTADFDKTKTPGQYKCRNCCAKRFYWGKDQGSLGRAMFPELFDADGNGKSSEE